MSGTPRIGIEEEFHVVDLGHPGRPLRVTHCSPSSAGGFAPELQRSLVETTHCPAIAWDELRAEIVRLRGELAGAAHA